MGGSTIRSYTSSLGVTGHYQDVIAVHGKDGDFKNSNAYKGLNNFKLGFDAKIFEYIGEFDLVFDRPGYELLNATGKLANEFNKDCK